MPTFNQVAAIIMAGCVLTLFVIIARAELRRWLNPDMEK